MCNYITFMITYEKSVQIFSLIFVFNCSEKLGLLITSAKVSNAYFDNW